MDWGCVRKQICIATHLKAAAIDQDHVGVVGGDSEWELGWLGWRLTSLCAEENHRYWDGLPALISVHGHVLVREVVLDTGDDPDGLEVLVFLIAVFDGEESLVSIFDFAEA